MVDRVQVQQILVNLLRNAMDAMQGSSRRELVSRQDPILREWSKSWSPTPGRGSRRRWLTSSFAIRHDEAEWNGCGTVDQ